MSAPPLRAAESVIVLLIVAAAAVPGFARAQTPAAGLTVDELVVRALADNPDLRAARIDVEAAAARVQQAGLRPNPMLELGGQKALGTDNNLTVGLSLPLDLNGRKEGRVAVAERELDTKRRQVGDRERRLRADVRMKAGELLAAQRSLRVTEDLLRVNRDAMTTVGNRVREGAAPALEENLQLVEVNRLDASRQLAESRVEIATLQVKALAGMAPDAPLIVKGDLLPSPFLVRRDEAMQRAVSDRADVAVARAEVAMARAMVGKEQAEGRWDASVNVGYQRQDFGFGGLNGLTSSGATRPIQDVFHYFGGGVSIMLPVRNRNQGNIAAAEAAVRAAERRVEFTILTVQQEVAAALTQYEAAQRSRALYERGVRDVAARNVEVVRQAYQLGRGSLLDVIAEQRRYIDVENGYTDALKHVYDAAVDIERAVGAGGR
jgi:cobalt-zinc-cadmium efflux system outer membrane protein